MESGRIIKERTAGKPGVPDRGMTGAAIHSPPDPIVEEPAPSPGFVADEVSAELRRLTEELERTPPVPSVSVADEVSAELRRLSEELEHTKHEQLAAELHLPVVTPPTGDARVEIPEEWAIPPARQTRSAEKVSHEAATDELSSQDIPDHRQPSAVEHEDNSLPPEDSLQPTGSNEAQPAPQPDNKREKRSYRSLGDFIRKNL